MTGPGPPAGRDPIALARLAIDPSVEAAVAAVRDFLAMEVAFVTEFVGDEQFFRFVDGDGRSFGLRAGASLPSDQLYCRRILAGELPQLLADSRGHEAARRMPVTTAAEIGAFVSVPVKLSDGHCYGTLCAASHVAQLLLRDRDVQFLHVLARMIADHVERERLAEHARRLELQASAVSALSGALAARDGYTGEHSAAVVELALAVGRALGLDARQLADVERVAVLHDVGKLAIPDALLHKPGPLDEREWALMREHPVVGSELIAGVPALQHLRPVLRADHERWDGKGYPDGLAGEAIPLAARLTLVCDAYHAMTSDRPYRPALGHDVAIREIAAGAGSQFCPSCCRALLDVLARTPDPPYRPAD